MSSLPSLLGHCLPVGVQLLVILLTAAGWGYWLSRLLGSRSLLRQEDRLLCGLGGLCGCWLLLQDLACLGVRLAWSAWLGAAIAVLGVIGILNRVAAGGGGSPLWRGRRGWLAPAGVLLVVFGFQASGVLYWGRGDYYGYARQDQLTYVEIAQFLIEKPFATDYKDVGLHPWMVKAIDMKRWRIAQSVADAYVAVITGTDSEGAYGVTSVFFVALVSVSVLALLRSLGISPLLAWLGGLWAGILPAITQDHLDGFFPQVSTLFCLPALILALRTASRDFRLGLISASLLLAFLFGSYCEIYPIGLAIALGLSAVAFDLSGRRRIVLALTCALLPLALLWPCCADYLRLIASQYRGASNPNTLKEWGPHVGTWRGWSELFLVAPSHDAVLVRAQILGGFAVLLLVVAGLFSRSLARRAQLAVVALVPASLLGLLLSAEQFPKYAFGKLLICFASLGVVLAVLGLGRICQAVSGLLAPPGAARITVLPLRAVRLGACFSLTVLVALAGWASWSKLEVVAANGQGLPTMNSADARAVYRELDAHPERTYLLTEPHFILNGWFCYHARHSDFYSAVDQIGDRPVAGFLFRGPPAKGEKIWAVANGGVRELP